MKNFKNLKNDFERVRRVVILACTVVVLSSLLLVYLIIDPSLSAFKNSERQSEMVDVPLDSEKEDRIEDGIHVRTGFVDAPGMIETVQNCTNCHSSKLVIQNRMNAERWKATIQWMQETQNLWDLGENEEVIINYLVTNYPPKKKGRREGLADIEWYTLKE
ncbi:sulfite dehydrogenase (cytochrome) subunit SorB [Flavobacteriaceae bacterium MAR_2009_75]|nr:sulfite dehydrogenase (cytochrome) subunit SorB [Flavobacteriaceae bacterium MAR_2009_75]